MFPKIDEFNFGIPTPEQIDRLLNCHWVERDTQFYISCGTTLPFYYEVKYRFKWCPFCRRKIIFDEPSE